MARVRGVVVNAAWLVAGGKKMDLLSVDSVSLINHCSLESTSGKTDLQGEYFKPITSEGLSLLSDDSSLKEELRLQGFTPFQSSSMDNKAAWHPGEEIWDKFQFPNDAETERKKITNLMADTMKWEKVTEDGEDIEMWEELKPDVFPKEMYVKEDVMWCPKSHLLEIVTLAREENKPVGEILAAHLANTRKILLHQTHRTFQSPCVFTIKAEQKHSLLKINHQKCIVETSSSNPQHNVKEIPTANCCVPSPNALHGVTPNNSTSLVKSSNTVPTSPIKTHLKNAVLNTDDHLFKKPLPVSSYAFKAKRNVVKANSSNNVVANYPAKAELKNRLINTSAFSAPRNEHTSSVSNRNNSTNNGYQPVLPPKVECSKGNGTVVHCAKQDSSAYSNGKPNFIEKHKISSNNSTQKRKLLLNTKPWQQLRAAVPSTEHRRWASRVVILQEAAKYCKEIPYIIREQRKKLHELRSQRKKLNKKLSLLQLEVAVAKVRRTLYKEFKVKN